MVSFCPCFKCLCVSVTESAIDFDDPARLFADGWLQLGDFWDELNWNYTRAELAGDKTGTPNRDCAGNSRGEDPGVNREWVRIPRAEHPGVNREKQMSETPGVSTRGHRVCWKH